MGAAYEYLLKHFADESGKKGGQFYTPSTVVRLLVQLLKPEEKMSIYDPTVGSGGMLIQSHNYITEQGENANNLQLFGQELDPTVVAICKMNIILHNINKYKIEYGDTLTDPLNEKNGQLIKFDRVIANPPFSQNYNEAEMKYKNRFSYGFTPETGKKADLMFVQHMLASCKKKGRVVVVMPHGVLFRGGKEKDIRKGMLNADVIEGIIGLPPQLFYGTGIPACIIILNKSKADKLKNKVFIINADKEYAEGKKQNKLRPEDVEKIDFVFSNKIEVEKYAKLVKIKTIEENDYNLNIRRYVDNTPEPEPQNVKAHLTGGVPVEEIKQVENLICEKFNFNSNKIFDNNNKTYKYFSISEKTEIKKIIDNDKNIEKTLFDLGSHLTDWWKIAKKDFSKLAKKENDDKDRAKETPKIRKKLLNTIKEKFISVGVLDRFQVAGVFVNWWDSIKYDLKIIAKNGWEAGLIPDRYLIDTFFAKEQNELENLETEQAENEANLDIEFEQTTTLLELVADEGETFTTKVIKKELKSEINYLKKEKEDEKVLKPYQDADNNIKKIENNIKKIKATLKQKQKQLALKLIIKRYGTEDEKTEANKLLKITNTKIQNLNTDIEILIAFFKTDLKDSSDYDKIKNSAILLEKQLKKDKSNPEKLEAIQNAKNKFREITKPYNVELKNKNILETKIQKLDKILKEINGQITTKEAQNLILKKHFDIINNQLQRYLNSEKRNLIAQFENLWDKYAVSAQSIEKERTKTMKELNDFLTDLKYLD